MIPNTSEKWEGTRSIAPVAKCGRVMCDRKYDTWRRRSRSRPYMLVDAGPRFSTLDPSVWPEMARLLAGAEWQHFKDLSQAGAESNGR